MEAAAVPLALPPRSDEQLHRRGHQSRDEEQATVGCVALALRSGQALVLRGARATRSGRDQAGLGDQTAAGQLRSDQEFEQARGDLQCPLCRCLGPRLVPGRWTDPAGQYASALPDTTALASATAAPLASGEGRHPPALWWYPESGVHAGDAGPASQVWTGLCRWDISGAAKSTFAVRRKA